jgi:hypothetical protein
MNQKVSIIQALYDHKYRVATWITLIYIIFHELTAINVIMLYSKTIFKNMNTNSKSGLTPR